jgi:hypothetical protein
MKGVPRSEVAGERVGALIRGIARLAPCRAPIAPLEVSDPYRTALLADNEGKKVMRELKRFIGTSTTPSAFVFRSQRGGPLLETAILSQCLHPDLEALGFPRAGFHAFRRGCNRRWKLAGLNPAVHRQIIGHSWEAMTGLYSGEILLGCSLFQTF